MHNRNYKRNNKRKLLDETFNLEKSYFFQELKDSELDSIKAFIDSYFSKGIKDVEELEKFFTHYPVLTKGDQNIKKLRKALEEIATQHKDQESFFDSYSSINNFIIDEYMTTKPTVLEVLFFPSETNEDKVANMIRTSKKSLNIAIFTLTNDRLTAAVEEVYQRGVEVRIITDDECCKNLGSDIFRLALLGIPIKTDDSFKNHMHDKFAVIDEAVVLTGSFNWTSQAVKYNQENILFIQNDELAKKYMDEFNKLWMGYGKVISYEDAKKMMAD